MAFEGKPVVNEYLLDEKKAGIQDEQGRFIILEQPEILELLDEQGRYILNEQLEPIILD